MQEPALSRSSFGVDQTWPVAHARLMVALLNWHKFDGDNEWLDLVGRMSDGLAGFAETAGDRAWYYTARARIGIVEGTRRRQHGQHRNRRVVAEPETRAFYVHRPAPASLLALVCRERRP